MHLKRFEGKTLKETLERVKSELGPDALILSSRTFRKEHGILGLLGTRRVEVMAASEPASKGASSDVEAKADLRAASVSTGRAGTPKGWSCRKSRIGEQDGDGLRTLMRSLGYGPALESLYERFVRTGVHPHLAFRLVQEMHPCKSGGDKDEMRSGEVVSRFVRFADREAEDPRIIVMVGSTGVGKTTTLAKLAARDRLTGMKRVALVTLDTYRIAAAEQLRVYAQILGVPFYVVSRLEQFPPLLSKLSGMGRVYVDTAGTGPRDSEHLNELKETFHGVRGVHPMLLIGANTNELDASHIMDRYSILEPGSLTITKLDEALHLGPMLNILWERGIPLAYLSTGQRVPDDLDRATPRRFMQALLRQ